MHKAFSSVLSKIDKIGWEKHSENLLSYSKKLSLNGTNIKNLSLLKETGSSKKALIVSAGPSLIREGTLESLRNIGRKDYILVCVDATLVSLLKIGLIPDYCVTLDPHVSRPLRWFGDPNIEKHQFDDQYFNRQDLNMDFRNSDRSENDKNIKLVNKHGPEIDIIASTCLAPELYERLNEIKFKSIYGFNPLVDDPKSKGSLTKKLFETNNLTCINTGGNVGTTAWIFCQHILNVEKLGAIGFDYCYYWDTPFSETQTYTELCAYKGSTNIDEFFLWSESENGRKFYQDPTFYWYCDNFMGLLSASPKPLFNLSKAGLLYGENVKSSSLEEFFGG